MSKRAYGDLSRRERQIMDVIYQRGEASVADVLAGLPDAPSYSAVRAMLRILEQKGHLKHRREGVRYVYLARQSRRVASRSALKRVLHTFFDGSVERAVAALLDDSDAELSKKQLERMAELVRKAKKQGR